MSLSEEAPPTTLQQYASYPFSSDDEYQSGLKSLIEGGVLANDPPEEIKAEILRRTRVFYFNSVTGHTLSVEEVRAFEGAPQPDARGAPSSDSADAAIPDDAPPVLTFAQLQALIEAGREDQIPNNKVIPDDLNDAPPTVSTAPVRKKPWEMAQSESGGQAPGVPAEVPVA